VNLRRFAALLALGAALAAAASAPRRAGDRAVLTAVDAEAFAGLTGRRPEAAGDLWERLKAMGVSAALLREDTLADLAARGEVLNFSRPEVEKWRAAGLVSPNGLRGGTLWTKDPKALARAADALAARGFDASTATVAGAKTLEIPPGVELSRVPAGFDPVVVAGLSSAGLLPVAASSGPLVEVAGRGLWTRTLPVDASRGEILRAALGRPLRLLVFRPRPELALEANLEFLRASLRIVREAGQPATLPAPRPVPFESGAARLARLALVWLLGAAGPLLAARAALQTARLMRPRVCSTAPLASPVPQILAGLAGGWAVAAFAGLVAAGVAPEGWRDGSARAWTVWTWCAPLAVGSAALFAEAGSSRRGGWAAPVRRRDLAALAALALAAAALVAPRSALRASALWGELDRLPAGALWWWPWHWRAALVGVPCLGTALALIERRDGASDPRRVKRGGLSEPRGWLLLGLLGPAGLVAAVGAGGAPLADALGQGAAAWALGLAGAAALALLVVLLERWAQGPKTHRTIDLESIS
jgi:hypothetical protein